MCYVAKVDNLVKPLNALGFDACMVQTGGIYSACSIYFEDSSNDIEELLITYQWYYGGASYCIEAYDCEGDIVESDWSNIEFETQDELIAWLCSNRNKF